MSERILRKPEVRQRIPVGKTKLEEDILPRLDKVILGPRCVGFTEGSVDRLIRQLILESATAASIVPRPNVQKGQNDLEERNPSIGDAEAFNETSEVGELHLTNCPHLFKIAIDHVVTADMDDGQPLPPFIEDGVVWCVVRRQRGRTLWRRITLTPEHSAGVTLDGGLQLKPTS